MQPKKLPISLIIDDSGPINLMSVQDPQPWRVRNVPVSFLERFIENTRAQGIRGKFTMVPCPNCLGNIDEGIPGYPAVELSRFIELVRTEIEPLWDITPEILTHWNTLDLNTGAFLDIREDQWSYTQNADTLTAYLAHALRILKNAGLHANGITSPYFFGTKVEAAYAEAVGRSLAEVYGLREAWYFLHYSADLVDVRPRIMLRDAAAGTSVVSVVVCTDDNFWNAQYNREPGRGLAAIRPAINKLLSEDGRTGRFIDILDAGQPVVFLTHWQSLFAEGTGEGLDGLVELGRRVNEHLPHRAYWTTPSEIARQAVSGQWGSSDQR
jgi:hypothetical protein